jgi:hypothetical protein
VDGSPRRGEEDTVHRRKVVVTDSRRLEVRRLVTEPLLRAWASPPTRTVRRKVHLE